MDYNSGVRPQNKPKPHRDVLVLVRGGRAVLCLDDPKTPDHLARVSQLGALSD